MDIKPITPDVAQKILDNFVQIEDLKKTSLFCVDGRKGSRHTANGQPIEGAYFQALGGSFHLSALKWILDGGAKPYSEVIGETFKSLAAKGYRIGAHTGGHSNGTTSSDCGFDDNFGKIVSVLSENNGEIWNIITAAAPSLAGQTGEWDRLMEQVKKASSNLAGLPTGYEMVLNTAAKTHQADIQELEGDHKEVAAVVNLKTGTTLDVDRNQETQAFNLDLWNIIDMAQSLGMDKDEVTLLSLGLYVATEMVLVEQKRGYRIPVIVNA